MSGLEESKLQRWEKSYREGRWKYLNSLEQLPRYSVIAAWCHYLCPNGSILDIGCGEGILLDWLHSNSQYLGVDLASEAISIAQDRKRNCSGNFEFRCRSSEDHLVKETQQYDIIVFNEFLYYCEDPIEQIREYAELSKSEGIIIVSISGASANLIKSIEKTFDAAMITRLDLIDPISDKSWKLAILRGHLVE